MRTSRTSFRHGVAALPFAGALMLAGTAWAQSTQGQFTPDAAAPIHLHMPVHLHQPPRRQSASRPKPKLAPQAADTTTARAPQKAQAAPIPFGSGSPPAEVPAPHKAAAVGKPKAAYAERAASASTGPPAGRADRRKAVEEVLSGSASEVPSSSTAADVSAPGAAIPFSFDAATVPEAAPKSTPVVRSAPKEKHSNGVPMRPRTSMAALEPAPKSAAPEAKPKTDPHAGLVKQGEILFDGASTDPQADGASEAKSIAQSLNTALESESARVEIEAFGGAPGDKSSDARRLSLRRALAVRQLLIDSGIPAERIDVKALGGIDDHGNAERVDVYLRGSG
ncbi:MAG TPA: OmpA family protein [Terriglobales bacterium]|nr:OmpA family protein [Terriglobales bacterium]